MENFWRIQDEGIARAEAAMRGSTQSDESIKEILKAAQTRPPSQKEIEFFSKHGLAALDILLVSLSHALQCLCHLSMTA